LDPFFLSIIAHDKEFNELYNQFLRRQFSRANSMRVMGVIIAPNVDTRDKCLISKVLMFITDVKPKLSGCNYSLN
jgi:hypothetical protein